MQTIEAEVIETATSDSTALTPVPAAMTPMNLLEKAVASGNLDMAAKMMDLHERWERNQARKAFDEAMAAAKSEIPTITKNREVDFTSQKGRTHYRHEDLAEIAKTVDPILAKHGLSYRFRATSEANAPVTVTCVVSHRLGHSEEITLSAGRDESGNKNSIQAVGSAITYLQRYTLKAALGLAASNDDDGKSAGNGSAITDKQAEEISNLIIQTKSNIGRFCQYMKVESIPDIPASQYQRAIDALKAKVQQQ